MPIRSKPTFEFWMMLCTELHDVFLVHAEAACGRRGSENANQGGMDSSIVCMIVTVLPTKLYQLLIVHAQ